MMLAVARNILSEYGLKLEFKERPYRGRTVTDVHAVNPMTATSHKLSNLTDFAHMSKSSFRSTVERVAGKGKTS
jgi:hypothetical protein